MNFGVFLSILVYLVIHDSGQVYLERPLLSWYPSQRRARAHAPLDVSQQTLNLLLHVDMDGWLTCTGDPVLKLITRAPDVVEENKRLGAEIPIIIIIKFLFITPTCNVRPSAIKPISGIYGARNLYARADRPWEPFTEEPPSLL